MAYQATKGGRLYAGGRSQKPQVPESLADVAPTVLKLMGLEQPAEMTGKALVEMK